MPTSGLKACAWCSAAPKFDIVGQLRMVGDAEAAGHVAGQRADPVGQRQPQGGGGAASTAAPSSRKGPSAALTPSSMSLVLLERLQSFESLAAQGLRRCLAHPVRCASAGHLKQLQSLQGAQDRTDPRARRVPPVILHPPKSHSEPHRCPRCSHDLWVRFIREDMSMGAGSDGAGSPSPPPTRLPAHPPAGQGPG